MAVLMTVLGSNCLTILSVIALRDLFARGEESLHSPLGTALAAISGNNRRRGICSTSMTVGPGKLVRLRRSPLPQLRQPPTS
jgi:hypothetical protein